MESIPQQELPRGFLGTYASEATLCFGDEGTLTGASPTAARLFGYASHAVFLRAVARGELAKLGLPDAQAWVKQLLAAGEVVVEDRPLNRRNGTPFPCRIIAGPRCQEGRAVGVQAVLEDRTNQDAVRTFVAAIMNALPNPVFVKDAAHRWIALNEAYCRFMGCTPEERLGKSDFDCQRPSEAVIYWQRDDLVFATGATDENEEPYTDDEGHLHFLITRKSRHLVGGQPVLVGVITDITERKRMEEELRSSRLQLEQRVQERTAALQQVNEDLRRLHLHNDEFISMLSHELRNPLSPLGNGLYLLKRNPSLDAPARATVAIIERQVRHLTRLVEDLLDITRVAHGKTQLRKERLDLCAAVQRTLEDHLATLTERDVSAELPPRPVWILADATRLAQVVGNLVENAAKFTSTGGHLQVSLRTEGTSAVLQVTDDGVGIDDDTLHRLFHPFAQADRTLDRSRGGLGLGLALVKGLVELHGGSIAAHSEGRGRGARFTVTLPLADPQDATPSSTRKPGPDDGGAHRSLLLIEDNRDAADSLKAILELEGHAVEVAYDGPSGLNLAKALHPDIILCDIGLPGMDGYAVARALTGELKQHPSLLVALTGYARPEDQRRAREAGFNRHLAKPVSAEALYQLLAEAHPVHPAH